jgi:hypothetical protein
MYILFEDDGSYVLSATSGGVGMYEVKVRLDCEEVARYRDEGEEFIEALAYDIGRRPGKYEDRSVP